MLTLSDAMTLNAVLRRKIFKFGVFYDITWNIDGKIRLIFSTNNMYSSKTPVNFTITNLSSEIMCTNLPTQCAQFKNSLNAKSNRSKSTLYKNYSTVEL